MVESKHIHFIHLTWVHFLLLFILMLLHHRADAQSTLEPEPTFASHHNWDSSIAIMIGALVCAFLFMGIFSIYMRHCTESYLTERNPIGATADWPCSCSKGIERELLETFPILFYSTIKDLKFGKGALECAVCLSDFKDYETLRLLPKCNHVFHPNCIDAWLASHVTCPVCRAKLNQDLGEIAIAVPAQLSAGEMFEESSGSRADLDGGEENEIEQHPVVHNATEGQSNADEDGGKGNLSSKSNLYGNLPRSNSTGHSLVEPGKCMERYTLRLPEDVRRYILLNHGTVQRSASYRVLMPMVGSSMKGLCWSDSEGSSRGKRNNVEQRQERRVLWTPPFVARHG